MADDYPITISIGLSTDEAADFARLLVRLDAKAIQRLSWRSQGDDPVRVARWQLVLQRLKETLHEHGYYLED